MALDFAAGCVGGAAGVLIGYPLDTVKVKIQTQDPTKGLQYRGTFHCLSEIFKNEGVKGLYRGMSSPLAGVAGINAITFGVYGNVLRQMEDPDSVKSVALAGSTAGLIQTLIVSPMELVKTQMQVGGETSISGTLKHIYEAAGASGLARGMGITFTREVPAFGIYFGAYEIMIREFGESTMVILAAGGMAGVLSWVFTYPQDVIKSRLQADGFGAKQKYSGVMSCLKLSLAREGHQFLSRGLVSTVIRAFPMNAATFFVYSLVMKTFTTLNEKADEVYDTLKSLKGSAEKFSRIERVPNTWSKKKRDQRLATVTTDMPNILLVKEQATNIAQWRLHPERILYACPTVHENFITTESNLNFRNNFNQFNQYWIEEESMEVVPTVQRVEEDRPSLLTDGQEACWKTKIRTSDFLLPTNLLANSQLGRIYGFYYIVA